MCINILCLEEKLFNFKNLKFAQILHVDKTCFLRPGHISQSINSYVASFILYVYIHIAQKWILGLMYVLYFIF